MRVNKNCDMSKNEQYSSFTCDDSNEKYYLMQQWSNVEDNGFFFKLVLSDCTNYWVGNYYRKEIQLVSNLDHFVDLDGIKLQCFQAFSNQARSNFSIKLVRSEDFSRINLVVKKLLESEIKVEIISLTLKILDDPTPKTSETNDFVIKKLNEQEARIAYLENELKRVENEKKECIKTLNEFVVEKEEIESDLYSKFLVILNEKKAKIRELVKGTESD